MCWICVEYVCNIWFVKSKILKFGRNVDEIHVFRWFVSFLWLVFVPADFFHVDFSHSLYQSRSSFCFLRLSVWFSFFIIILLLTHPHTSTHIHTHKQTKKKIWMIEVNFIYFNLSIQSQSEIFGMRINLRDCVAVDAKFSCQKSAHNTQSSKR